LFEPNSLERVKLPRLDEADSEMGELRVVDLGQQIKKIVSKSLGFAKGYEVKCIPPYARR